MYFLLNMGMYIYIYSIAMLVHQRVPSQSLTWNLKMAPWNRRFLLETIIFRFHFKFQGGSSPHYLLIGFITSKRW